MSILIYPFLVNLYCSFVCIGMCPQLEQSKDDLEAKIQIEKIKKPKVEPEFLTFWLTRFRKMDMSSENGRKMLIDTFVSSIFLYDDKLIITFNYRDGKAEISLSELNELAATGSDMVCSTARNRNLSEFMRI